MMPVGGRAAQQVFSEQFKTCAGYAFANLLQHRLRLVAAISGIAVALFLLLLQIAVLNAVRAKVTQLFDDFNFDMAVVPDTYQFLLSFDTMDRAVLDVARATGDFSGVYGLNVDVVSWAQLPSMLKSYSFLIGLDDPGSFLRDRAIRRGLNNMPSSHSVLIDEYSQPATGSTAIGTAANINGERVTISGQYRLGLFFYADGSAVVRNSNFAGLSGRDTGTISMGLLQLNPNIESGRAKRDLARTLPPHTLVLTRDELRGGEQSYFLSTKPIGIMIYISMLIACGVGGAIIIQVLATEISNRMNELSVLKAMGSSPALIYGIGMAEAAIVALGGLIPALLVGAVVLQLIQYFTHLQSALSLPLILTMLGITLFLAVLATMATAGRVMRADPASLY